MANLAAAASNPTLEKEVVSARDGENAASTVYADWLQTQGDVRGELASLFLNNKEGDANAWIAANKDRLFGELADKVDGEIYNLVWRGGFLRGASLKRADIDSNTDLGDLTRKFLALPVARLVTELRFGLAGYESDNDWSETMAAIAASPQAAALRSLRFDDYTYEDSEISWTAFGDFSEHWEAFPALEELQIRSGEGGELGEIDLPNLKKFVRVSGGLGSGEIESIFSASWPKLEHLEVWFGSRSYGASGKVEHLQPLLDGNVPRTLRTLGIVNCEFVGDALAALAKSPVLKQLRVLDCSKGMLDDDQARVLIDNYAAFSHLERLDLSENLLNTQGDAILAKLPNANVGESRYEEGRERRYVALGE